MHMNKVIMGIGVLLILVGGVMLLGTFNTYRRAAWADVSQAQALLTPQVGHAYVALTNLEKGQIIKVTAGPTEPADSLQLVLVTEDKYTQYIQTGIDESDTLVWKEPTSLGQELNFEYTITAPGVCVIIIHPLKDNGETTWQDGIPFSFEMEVSTPLDLKIPGFVVALIGVGLIAFGVLRKPKPQQVAQPPPPPPPI